VALTQHWRHRRRHPRLPTTLRWHRHTSGRRLLVSHHHHRCLHPAVVRLVRPERAQGPHRKQAPSRRSWPLLVHREPCHRRRHHQNRLVPRHGCALQRLRMEKPTAFLSMLPSALAREGRSGSRCWSWHRPRERDPSPATWSHHHHRLGHHRLIRHSLHHHHLGHHRGGHHRMGHHQLTRHYRLCHASKV